MEDEGWQNAMQGCDYVLHVASPFVTSQPKDENDLIRPAVEGTQRALKSGQKRWDQTKSAWDFIKNQTGKGLLELVTVHPGPVYGNAFNGDISATMDTFNWKPLPLEKTVLDTARSVEEALQQ